MSFEVYYEVKLHEEVLFITCMLSWKVLADVWSSYSVENPLAPAFEERNSTMVATLGALKFMNHGI